jgi:hypothetical protein
LCEERGETRDAWTPPLLLDGVMEGAVALERRSFGRW